MQVFLEVLEASDVVGPTEPESWPVVRAVRRVTVKKKRNFMLADDLMEAGKVAWPLYWRWVQVEE